MLQAGVDLSTITIWLRHKTVQITHKCMVADMKMKEEALRKSHMSAELKPVRLYSLPNDILAFLESL